MLFFNRSVSFEDAGMMSGYTDWHSHILPGVDDGVKTMEDALEILKEYERMGVKRLCLTPHIMEDIPNETSMLKERFAELQEEYFKTSPEGSRIELCLGAENMIDSLFMDRLEKQDFLPLGPMMDTILVETSYYNPPINFYETIKAVKSAGYHIMLAHPERYHYMGEKEYEQLHEMNVSFQMNLLSLPGAYGKDVRAKALKLMSKGWYRITGSDLHSMKHLNILKKVKLTSKEMATLKTII